MDRASASLVDKMRHGLSRWGIWSSAAWQCFRLLVVFAVFVLFDTILARTTNMSATDFDTDVLFFRWITDTKDRGMFVGLLVLALFCLPAIRCRWSDLEAPWALRTAIMAFAIAISWPFLTISYNYYFDQAYLWDRVLLLGLLTLSLWRPAMLFGVAALCYLLMWQYSWPALGGPVFAHKHLLLELVTAFLAWFVLRRLRFPTRPVDLVFLLGVIVAGRYWAAGYAKLQLEWLSYGNVHHALIAAYSHGWLGWLAESSVLSLAKLIAATEPWVQYGVIAFELAALAFFAHRKIATAILVLAVAFHLAVVVLYGFVFWTWIAADLILLWLLWKWPDDPISAVPAIPRIVVGCSLVATSPAWTDATRLAWFDSSLSYGFRYTLHDGNGAAYSVSPRFFAPYDDQMTMASFSYLVERHGTLAGPYGVVFSLAVAQQLDRAGSPQDVDALQSSKSPSYDPVRSQQFADFLRRSLAVWNTRGPQLTWLKMLAPPAQFQSFVGADGLPRFSGDAEISRATVDVVTSWYDGNQLHEVRREVLLDVNVPDTLPPLPESASE